MNKGSDPLGTEVWVTGPAEHRVLRYGGVRQQEWAPQESSRAHQPPLVATTETWAGLALHVFMARSTRVLV